MTSTQDEGRNPWEGQLGYLEMKVLEGIATPAEIAEYGELSMMHHAWVCSQPWFSACGETHPHPSHKFLDQQCHGVTDD